MLEEYGYVVSEHGGEAWVSVERRTACESCSVQKGCGTSVLSKVVGKKIATIKVNNTLHAKVGDQVRIGIDDQAMVSGSALLYLSPLLGLFLSSLCIDALFHQELLTILAAVAGLGAGFWFVRWYVANRHMQNTFQAKMLAIDNHQKLHFSAKLLS